MNSVKRDRTSPASADPPDPLAGAAPMILSLDVEEHHRIEAAAHLELDDSRKENYRERMVRATEWILESLGDRSVRASFFIVGQIAINSPRLVKRIHAEGHEIASHSWAHERIHRLNPLSFRQDTLQSKDVLEQLTGSQVVGYRAPTFSVVPSTSWAIDILAELGFLYDASIYPIRHDRYGVPSAPRGPFLARGHEREILELPTATLRLGGMNLPIGGGGYFRLLPGPWMRHALSRARLDPHSRAVSLYFHPWEFDPEQPRLELRPLSRWRTYVGVRRTRERFARLLDSFQFERAVDVARDLEAVKSTLPRFHLSVDESPKAP